MSADSVMVDPEALAIALEDHDPETEWVLDLRRGEVIPVTNPLVTGGTATRDEVAGDPERYLEIEPIPAHESLPNAGSRRTGSRPGSVQVRARRNDKVDGMPQRPPSRSPLNAISSGE